MTSLSRGSTQRINVPSNRADLKEEGRRLGIVLGLTIAEIILLILFAVVLAMAGVLMKRGTLIKEQVERQVLTDTNKLLKDPTTYQAGSDFQKFFGKDAKVSDVFNEQRKLQSDLDKLKSEMAKSGNVEILPPCLRIANGGNIPYIYDIAIRNDGVALFDTSPDLLKPQLKREFPNPPPLGKILSAQEFKSLTNSYIDYGKRNQCKFYVKVYDETQNNKDKFKSQLKIVESNFVWTFMMSLKPGAQSSEDLNLFQTAPLK